MSPHRTTIPNTRSIFGVLGRDFLLISPAPLRKEILRLTSLRKQPLTTGNDTLLLGALAQLGERLHGMQEVSGSIPLCSTIPFYFSDLEKR